MAHAHHHGDHSHDHAAIKNIKIAFFLNLSFTFIELIGGLITNSTAILADAIHDLGDSLALGQAWYFESISKKKGTSLYTYGYRRFSLLGAFISAMTLLVSSMFVLTQAIPRLFAPQTPHSEGMMILAIMGIGINSIAMLRLIKGRGANVRLVALHLLEDVLGWVAVLVVAIILQFHHIPVLDPVLAILITFYILYNTIKTLRKIVPVFLQAAPVGTEVKDISRQLERIELIQSVHHLHVWSLDEEHSVLSAHLVTNRALDPDEYASLKQKLKNLIKENGIAHSTLEIEWSDEECRNINSSCRE